MICKEKASRYEDNLKVLLADVTGFRLEEKSETLITSQALIKLTASANVLTKNVPDSSIVKQRQVIREILTTKRSLVEPHIPEAKRDSVFTEEDTASNETYIEVPTNIKRLELIWKDKCTTHG